MLFKSLFTLATFALGVTSVFAVPAAKAEPESALVKKQGIAGLAQILTDATTALGPVVGGLRECTLLTLPTPSLTSLFFTQRA